MEAIATDMVIDLNGPDGNVFVLIGILKKLISRKDFGLHPEEVKMRVEDMMSGDYRHALEVFEENLPDVLLMNKPEEN